MTEPAHDDEYVKELFNRMGPSYPVVNLVSSFGFSLLWRRICVRNARLEPDSAVCDMMSGSGECWPYILRPGRTLVAVDFSSVMIERQHERNRKSHAGAVDVRLENALHTTIGDGSMDRVISSFGLKTLDEDALRGFIAEMSRILKPGGRFSLLEISSARGWWLGPVYRWYLKAAIPQIGRLLLGDIECYRMLGRYTEDFGGCENVIGAFRDAGFETEMRKHFFGCATSIVGRKPL